MTSHMDRRKFLISKIRATMAKAEEGGIEIDKEKLIKILGAEEGVARRTAMDYIECARMQLEQIKSNTAHEWDNGPN